MPRPPAPDGTPTKTFVVKEGYTIGGYDGERKDAGDQIELTKAQAQYFQKLGSITFDLGAVFDDTPFDDPEEDGSGEEADGEGDADVGDASEPSVPKKRAPARGRKRSS